MSASFMYASIAQSKLSHLPASCIFAMPRTISAFARSMTISRQWCFVSVSVITSAKLSVTSATSDVERSNEACFLAFGEFIGARDALRSTTEAILWQLASKIPAVETDSFPVSLHASSRMSGRLRTSRQSTGVPLFVRSRSMAKDMGSLPIFSSLLERTLAPVLMASEGTVEARWLICIVTAQ
eukprot:scaffold27455_cov66-Phaeocystis_antarctica.AAC.3